MRPWLSAECIGFLDRLLGGHEHVFEYGSGGSTLFFAGRARSVVSVEHSRGWHARVRRELREQGRHNVLLRCIPPDGRFVRAPPAIYKSGSLTCWRCTFHRYAAEIDRHRRPFDFVLVDGRARAGCMAHARAVVAPGGWLVLDDSQRRRYAAAKRAMRQGWEMVVLPGKTLGSTTHLWRRH